MEQLPGHFQSLRFHAGEAAATGHLTSQVSVPVNRGTGAGSRYYQAIHSLSLDATLPDTRSLRRSAGAEYQISQEFARTSSKVMELPRWIIQQHDSFRLNIADFKANFSFEIKTQVRWHFCLCLQAGKKNIVSCCSCSAWLNLDVTVIVSKSSILLYPFAHSLFQRISAGLLPAAFTMRGVRTGCVRFCISPVRNLADPVRDAPRALTSRSFFSSRKRQRAYGGRMAAHVPRRIFFSPTVCVINAFVGLYTVRDIYAYGTHSRMLLGLPGRNVVVAMCVETPGLTGWSNQRMEIGFVSAVVTEAIPNDAPTFVPLAVTRSDDPCADRPNSSNPLNGAVKTEFSTSKGPASLP
jgi:hypothetical protein